MPRKKLQRSDRVFYHVTNRSNNREWFYISIDQAWEIFCTVLTIAAERYRTEIGALVLMSNHFHLLLSTPLKNLDAFLRYAQTEIARKIQKRAGRINHIFGTRYKHSVLEDPWATAYVYKYILRNPVRAGISKTVETYSFSSLTNALSGRCDIPHMERLDSLWSLIPKEESKRLAWLNMPTPQEQELLIKNALRRKTFQFSRGNEYRMTLEALGASYGLGFAPRPFSAEK